MRRLGGEAAADLAAAPRDRLSYPRRADDLVIEHDGEPPSDTLFGRRPRKLSGARRIELEIHDRLVGSVIANGLGILEVLAAEDDLRFNDLESPLFPSSLTGIPPPSIPHFGHEVLPISIGFIFFQFNHSLPNEAS